MRTRPMLIVCLSMHSLWFVVQACEGARWRHGRESAAGSWALVLTLKGKSFLQLVSQQGPCDSCPDTLTYAVSTMKKEVL